MGEISRPRELMSTHGGPRFVRWGVCGDVKAERVGLAPRPDEPCGGVAGSRTRAAIGKTAPAVDRHFPKVILVQR